MSKIQGKAIRCLCSQLRTSTVQNVIKKWPLREALEVKVTTTNMICMEVSSGKKKKTWPVTSSHKMNVWSTHNCIYICQRHLERSAVDRLSKTGFFFFNEKCTWPTLKHGCRFVMIWGYVAASGKKTLHM